MRVLKKYYILLYLYAFVADCDTIACVYIMCVCVGRVLYMLMMLPPLYRVTRANNISRYNIKQTGRKILIVPRVFLRTYQCILYIIVIHMETYTHTHNRPLCDVRTRIININAIRTCAAALPSLKS